MSKALITSSHKQNVTLENQKVNYIFSIRQDLNYDDRDNQKTYMGKYNQSEIHIIAKKQSQTPCQFTRVTITHDFANA